MKTSYQNLCVLTLFILTFLGCDSKIIQPPDGSNPTDSNYIEMPKVGTGNFDVTSWIGEKIYYAWPLSFMEVSDTFGVLSNIEITYKISRVNFLSTAVHSNKLIYYVSSLYPDISMGTLYELDTSSKESKIVLDSFNISAAFPYGEDSLIFYCYGKPLGNGYGYYIMSRTTKEMRLLLRYGSELGPGETVNGFDIDYEKKVIYFPLIKRTAPPKIARYFITTGDLDTLPISFNSGDHKYCLWLRLNSDNTKLLYSRFPQGVDMQIPAGEGAETGIIDLTTNSITSLDLRPKKTQGISVFPQWSPDDKSISFGYAAMDADGFIHPYTVYILKHF